MSVNLHKIVRKAIHHLHSDQAATLYRSTGRYVDGERGDAVQLFEECGELTMQIQSLGPDVVQLVDAITQAATLRKIWVFADTGAWSVNRPLGRTGDYLRGDDGRVWLVNAVIEDFTRSGWVSLQCQQQTTPVDIYYETEEGLCRLPL